MTTVDRNSTTELADSHPRRWAALFVMLGAAFMDLLDVTIVNIALPAVRDDLGASFASAQWVITAYTLAFGLGLITGGRLGDRYGRKQLFLSGVAVFTAASLLCGLAQSPGMLIGSRALQGLAAAVMIPQIMATVYAIFPAGERAGASGAYGGVTGLAAVLGPVLGGVFVTYDVFGLGWRAIFLVNIPLGIAALFAAARLVPENSAEHPLRMDLVGMGLVSVSVLSALYPLVQGGDAGWPGWMVALLVAAPCVLALYAWHAGAKERRDASSLVPLRLFTERGFGVGAAVLFTFAAVMIGFFLAVSLTLQIGLGFSAMKTGLLFLPWAIGTGITSASSDALVRRFGRHLVTGGALVMAAGALWFALALSPDSAWSALGPALFVAGVGMGAVFGPAFTVAGASVEARDAGAASGTLSAALQIGNAAGVALLGVLFFAPLRDAAGQARADMYIEAFRGFSWFTIGGLVLVALVAQAMPRRVAGYAADASG
ncbi:MFS transporter [Streptomyces lunaelactis]|uniref:MFS transporter n=1 Tax=Streptomyces lunaelactis TaxID=1535768 RepID=UPI0015846941|nr:MFS transporter [Streptomyces lunaelactis]NUK49205.1 MFS transporter [Streptomyces lunaelactis]NUK62956.1 MFS transporter [Streptomyces lunaelactis]